MNAQISHCVAVDTRGCGKVDNHTAQSCQAAAFRCPHGGGATAYCLVAASRLGRRRQVTGRPIAVQAALAAGLPGMP